MSPSFFSPLVEQAMRVAARRHVDHYRKATDLPYLSHPASVALILSRAGFDDDDLLAAALLHDVVEDTSYSPQELSADFPPKVVEYVTLLTERKLDREGRKRSWRERKQEHIQQIAGAPLPARAIALADKLHNLGTMLYDLRAGEDLWTRFGAPPEDVLWYHRSMLEQAAQEDESLKPLADSIGKLLARLEATLDLLE